MTPRQGFAAPLAVLVVIAASLLSVLAVDAALGESRAARAALLEVRAAVMAESVLVATVGTRLDSVAAYTPPGARLFTAVTGGGDSASASVVVLQPGIVLIAVHVEARMGGVRAIAGRRCFATIRAFRGVAAEARLDPLPANGWLPVP